MQRLKIILLIAIFNILGSIFDICSAKVTLPRMFSDGMVLQRESKVNLWGNANANSTIKISPSWSKIKYTATAGHDGKWKISLPTPEAGGPYSITFNDGEKLTLSNILIGELWICAGQSNMEMPMEGFKGQPVENAVEDIMHANDNNLRLFTVKRNSQLQPVDTVSGGWSSAYPDAVRQFSATAYYFGKELRNALKVPVGLIVTSWGGSSCESWMDPDWFKAFPETKIPKTQTDIWSPNRTATVLYNGMLHPLIGITMRGVIWYQGEDNVPRYKTYADMLSTMIKGWRDKWGEGDFPFYYCQIAPYDYSLINWDCNSAYLREQQSKVETMVPNTDMACLLDAGLKYGIHPRKKSIAGMRLAMLALQKTYGIKGLGAENAVYKNVTFSNDTAIISFNRSRMWVYGEHGMYSDNFEIAGADKVFHHAKAWIDRNKVYVKSDSVKAPVAVRYAFHDWVDADLFHNGLPISSFRTDNW